MTGMAEQMETARLLTPLAAAGKLEHTVRFVAADYEEWGDLEGARYYAKYIKSEAAQKNFQIVAAIDDEQSGWKEMPTTNQFDVFDCGGDSGRRRRRPNWAPCSRGRPSTYSKIGTTEGCMGENSDHYAMWEIGVPAVVFSEHDPFNNPHFDAEGGDTYDKIDSGLLFPDRSGRRDLRGASGGP